MKITVDESDVKANCETSPVLAGSGLNATAGGPASDTAYSPRLGLVAVRAT